MRERKAQQELEGGTKGLGMAGLIIDEAKDAVVRISSTGIIRMANKNALHMFGYAKVCPY